MHPMNGNHDDDPDWWKTLASDESRRNATAGEPGVIAWIVMGIAVMLPLYVVLTFLLDGIRP